MKVGLLTVSPYEQIDNLKGGWWEWACQIEWPDGTLTEGSIQGDGHDFAPETLTDEAGNEITPP